MSSSLFKRGGTATKKRRILFCRRWSLLLFVSCVFDFHVAYPQLATSYAASVIDTLTSPYMNGRGYVDSGDWKAANFIRSEMVHAGLMPFQQNYFQPFSIDVNTFPEKSKVKLNGKELIPGKEFLVDAASHSCKGSFKSISIQKPPGDTSLSAVQGILAEYIPKKHPRTIFLVSKDDFSKEQYKLWRQAVAQTNAFGSGGVMEFSDNKLTWDASPEQLPYCYVQVRGKLPAKKKSGIELDIDAELKKNYATQNIVGYLRGIAVPDSFVVFTGHYDHLGQMGDGTYFPGANDNASGISMLLNLSAYFSKHPVKYSIVFIAFSGEELGLLGSQYFVEHPFFPLGHIKFLVNLDIVGTGDDGIKVVNATEFPEQFDQLVKLNENRQYLKVVSPRGKAANSDHYPFYEKGVPCFFIYTMGGIAAYHDVDDRAETLPLTDYEDLMKLLIEFTESF